MDRHGEFKLLMEVVKGRIASSLPSMANMHEHQMWNRLEQSIADKAASVCDTVVQSAHKEGVPVNADWFCDRRRDIARDALPSTIRAALSFDGGVFMNSDAALWDSMATQILGSVTSVPISHSKLPESTPMSEEKETHDAAQQRGEDVEETGGEAGKRSRDEFEADNSSACEPATKAQAVTPVKDEDDASQTPGGRMRAEEHRRRQINSEMLNALRAELPERDRAAFTGGNNSTVNTLSHAIDFIQKLKEKKARCLQELALLDGADMGVLGGHDVPGVVHPLQQMSQQVQQQSQMNLSRMMPQPMAPQMGLEAFMGFPVPTMQAQQQAPNHRVSQYLKIAQVSALTLECLAFSNPNAWLPIGNVSTGNGVLSVHENNSLCGRIVGEIQVPFPTVLQRLQEGEWHQHIPDWSPCAVHSTSTAEVVGPGTGVYKTTLSAQSAPNSVLEVCQIRHVMASSTVQGRLILSFTSTSHDSPSLSPAAETAQMNPSGCILEATPDGQGCKVVVVMDLGPGWGAAEGLVQQLLRSNFQATTQMALGNTVPSTSSGLAPSSVGFVQPKAPAANPLRGMLPGSHPYHTQQGMDEKIMRAGSFPSLSLGAASSGPLGLPTRAPSVQEDFSFNMPSASVDLSGDIMGILKRAGKDAKNVLQTQTMEGSALKHQRSVAIASGVGSLMR